MDNFRRIGELAGLVMQRVEDQRSGPGQAPRAQLRDFVEVQGPRRERKSRGSYAPAVGASGGVTPCMKLVVVNDGVGSVSRRNGFPDPALPAPLLMVVGGRHAAT